MSNGVNLLAAGLNLPEESNGGSGIYLADGRIAESYISGVKKSRLITHEVPIRSSRSSETCQVTRSFSSNLEIPYIFEFDFRNLRYSEDITQPVMHISNHLPLSMQIFPITPTFL